MHSVVRSTEYGSRTTGTSTHIFSHESPSHTLPADFIYSSALNILHGGESTGIVNEYRYKNLSTTGLILLIYTFVPNAKHSVTLLEQIFC